MILNFNNYITDIFLYWTFTNERDNQLLFSATSEICRHQRQVEKIEEEVEKLQLKIREFYTSFSIWAGKPFKNGL